MDNKIELAFDEEMINSKLFSFIYLLNGIPLCSIICSYILVKVKHNETQWKAAEHCGRQCTKSSLEFSQVPSYSLGLTRVHSGLLRVT